MVYCLGQGRYLHYLNYFRATAWQVEKNKRELLQAKVSRTVTILVEFPNFVEL